MNMLQSNALKHSSETVLFYSERCQVITYKAISFKTLCFPSGKGIGTGGTQGNGDKMTAEDLAKEFGKPDRAWLAGNHMDTVTCQFLVEGIQGSSLSPY